MGDKKLIEMKNLIKELNIASDLYYNTDTPIMSDFMYDMRLAYLQELEAATGVIYEDSPSVRVGAPVRIIKDSISKMDIVDKPMLSLKKVHSVEEIASFESGYDITASIKCDGLSVRLIYNKGKLVSANTRGDGYIGNNITEHIATFVNVPLYIDKMDEYIIDGEAIIKEKDFEIINKDGQFSNPRNTASGTLALLDMNEVAKRRMSFIAWDVIKGGKSNLYHYNLEEACELGFETVPMKIIDATCRDRLDDINDVNKCILSIAKEKGIPCDGVVWRINDNAAAAKMGQTEHHFLNAIAWKPEMETYETTLLDIELSIGRTGVLTPVAVYEDVDMEGSICNRASLHNLSVMNNVLGTHPYVGQKLRVFKANAIIPQVFWAETEDINYDKLIKLSKCPVCGGDIEVKDNAGVVTLWCANSDCSGKLINRLTHYCDRKKGLEIKGLSTATIEKLIDWGWVESIKDIYTLSSHRDEWIKKAGFGPASVDKVLSAIETSKTCKLENFISALGIPLVGNAVSKELVNYYPTWESFIAEVGYGTWSDLPGFGFEMETAINTFDFSEAKFIAETYLTFVEETKEEKKIKVDVAGRTFCVTGKLGNVWSKRDDLIAAVSAAGGKVTSSVTASTSFLVTNDPTSGSAKNAAAQRFGIPIITEIQLNEMLS